MNTVVRYQWYIITVADNTAVADNMVVTENTVVSNIMDVTYRYYDGKEIKFVPKFTYRGVRMQTKGGYSGHIQNLKRKGILACTRVALRLPLTSMSLQSLEVVCLV